MPAVLKTAVPQGAGGSNPSLSAKMGVMQIRLAATGCNPADLKNPLGVRIPPRPPYNHRMAKFHLIEENYVAWHCPGCESGHGVPVNEHKSGRGWQWNGSLDSPTLAPSILVNVGRANPDAHLCHTFINNGMIQFLPDCTHNMAGKTVLVPEWD